MKRRDIITLLGCAAAWPLAARAQQPGLPVIGYLVAGSPDIAAAAQRAVQQGLRQAGYFEGRNIRSEVRAADFHYERLPELAADLVHRQVNVIVAPGVPAAMAAKAATTTVPIVFFMGADPVAFGLVGSLSRPGANLTGVATLGVGVGPKHLELLHELIPAATKVGLFVNPANPSSGAVTGEIEAAARTLGLQLEVLQARTEADFDAAFETLRQHGAKALIFSNETLFINRSEDLAALTLRHRVPAIHVAPEFAEAGGLMSYGYSISERNRLVGEYVGRILKGERPGNLPVQQVTKVELTINLKAAKALGITFPLTLLGRADEVIEQ